MSIRTAASLLCLMAGCSPRVVTGDWSLRRFTGTGGTIPGYVHQGGSSLCATGSRVDAGVINGHQMLIGDGGVFATNPTSGAVSCILLATTIVDSITTFRYQGDAGNHSAAVLRYFVDAGLPLNQVGTIDTNTLISVGGTVADISAVPPVSSTSFVAYVSKIHRQISGVPIADSFAWARFQSDGRTSGEGVYWPAIPSAAVSDAQALQAVLADAGAFAAYVASLPSGVYTDAGAVVVHHTRWLPPQDAGFVAFASFDVPPNPVGQMLPFQHFDINGHPLHVPLWQGNFPDAGGHDAGP
jgi:hypothetical protein